MAHYAYIHPHNNQVVKVLTGVDEDVTQTNLDGTLVGGSTEAWEEFYASQAVHHGLICRRTSYNSHGGGFRKNYAGVGYTWDEERDAFIPPKPWPSWVLDEDTCTWTSPVPYPSDGKEYVWNQNKLNWEEIPERG